MSKPETLLICASRRGLSQLLHATRTRRIRDAVGAAVDHLSSRTALCGASVALFFPFLLARKQVGVTDSHFCPDCAGRVMQWEVDEGINHAGADRQG